MYNRAVLLERDGRLVEAEDTQRRCLQLRERVLGEDHQQASRPTARAVHSHVCVTRLLQTLQSAVALASLVALGGDVEEGKPPLVLLLCGPVQRC